MIKIKFQDGMYLGFDSDDKAIKTTKEQAWVFTSLTGARTSIRYVFASRKLKGYNIPTFVNMQDVAPELWNK
jgi:hypothetical protein